MGMNGSSTEKELWEKAKGGDRAAWTILYTRYQAANLASAKKIVRNLEDAEDVVQTVWLRAWEKRQEIDDLGGWLKRALRHRAIDCLRTRKPTWSYPFAGTDEEGDREDFEVESPTPEEEEDSRALEMIRANPRFEERMTRFIDDHGERLLEPADYEIGYRLWSACPTRTQKEVARELGIRPSDVRAAAMRIRLEQEKHEREAGS